MDISIKPITRQSVNKFKRPKLNPIKPKSKPKFKSSKLRRKVSRSVRSKKIARVKNKPKAQSLTKKRLKPTSKNIFRNNQIQQLLDEIDEHKNRIMKLKEEIKKIKGKKLTKTKLSSRAASVFGTSSNIVGSINSVLNLDKDKEIIQIKRKIVKENDFIRGKKEKIRKIIFDVKNQLDMEYNFEKPTSRPNISPFSVEHRTNSKTKKIRASQLPKKQGGKVEF